MNVLNRSWPSWVWILLPRRLRAPLKSNQLFLRVFLLGTLATLGMCVFEFGDEFREEIDRTNWSKTRIAEILKQDVFEQSGVRC